MENLSLGSKRDVFILKHIILATRRHWDWYHRSRTCEQMWYLRPCCQSSIRLNLVGHDGYTFSNISTRAIRVLTVLKNQGLTTRTRLSRVSNCRRIVAFVGNLANFHIGIKRDRLGLYWSSSNNMLITFYPCGLPVRHRTYFYQSYSTFLIRRCMCTLRLGLI